MSVYATETDISNAIGADTLIAITDFNGNGAVDSGVALLALSEASALADSYLSAYLPISPVPDVLRRAVVDIAIWRLRSGRDQVTEHSQRAYEDAVRWLRDIGSGRATLPVLADDGSSSSDAGSPELVAEERLFTRSSMRGFL